MKILFAGDFCPINRLANFTISGNFQSLRDELSLIIAENDYSVVNFECSMTENGGTPIEKRGPNHSCKPYVASFLKDIGFDCVCLANNHFYDYGENGVEISLNAFESARLDTVGGGKNIDEASAILYKKVANNTVALINCCEHEFSIATEFTGGSNPIDPVKISYSIKEARKKADFVIVIVHGGIERYQLPTPRMQDLYRFFIDEGADAIIGHHQHCFSGFENYHNKLIFYGLGNFLFDHNDHTDTMWNRGFMVSIEFSNTLNYTIFPYKQCISAPGLTLLDEKDKIAFFNEQSVINEIISDRKILETKYKDFILKSVKRYRVLFEPYKTRLCKALFNRGCLPSFVSKNRKMALLNALLCESHFDCIINSLKSR